jgi:hypothetical protein
MVADLLRLTFGDFPNQMSPLADSHGVPTASLSRDVFTTKGPLSTAQMSSAFGLSFETASGSVL